MIEWALRRKGLPERMVVAVVALYVGNSCLNTVAEMSEEIGVGVGAR